MGGTLELQLVLCCHSDGCKEITRDYSGGNRAVVTSFHHGTYNYLDKNHSNDREQVQRNQVHRSKSHVAGCDAGEEGLAWTANLYVCQPAPVPDTSGHQAASMSSPLGCSLIFISPPQPSCAPCSQDKETFLLRWVESLTLASHPQSQALPHSLPCTTSEPRDGNKVQAG